MIDILLTMILVLANLVILSFTLMSDSIEKSEDIPDEVKYLKGARVRRTLFMLFVIISTANLCLHLNTVHSSPSLLEYIISGFLCVVVLITLSFYVWLDNIVMEMEYSRDIIKYGEYGYTLDQFSDRRVVHYNQYTLSYK